MNDQCYSPVFVRFAFKENNSREPKSRLEQHHFGVHLYAATIAPIGVWLIHHRLTALSTSTLGAFKPKLESPWKWQKPREGHHKDLECSRVKAFSIIVLNKRYFGIYFNRNGRKRPPILSLNHPEQ